jgi:hypothetical protein
MRVLRLDSAQLKSAIGRRKFNSARGAGQQAQAHEFAVFA